MIKNPTWQEANRVAIYKWDRGVELGRNVKPIHLAPVVQTLDSAIHRINHYPSDKYQGN